MDTNKLEKFATYLLTVKTETSDNSEETYFEDKIGKWVGKYFIVDDGYAESHQSIVTKYDEYIETIVGAKLLFNASHNHRCKA